MEIPTNNEPLTPNKFKSVENYIVAFLVLTVVYLGGYHVGRKGFIFEPKTFEVVNQKDQPGKVDYNLLWKTMEILDQKYIDKPADQQKLLYGAVSGAVASLGDPYTVFLPPKELTNFKTELAGTFGGIGAEVGQKNGNIVIIAPLDESPAEKAGVKAGDVVAAVNGEVTSGWAVDQAVEKIRGPKGTDVSITFIREGLGKPLEVKITRDTIVIKSVKWEFKEVGSNGTKKKIAIISVNEFGDNTVPLFNQAVQESLSNNVDGIVVDLRNNPGGYLQGAVDLASAWLKKGELVVTEAHSDGSKKTYNANSLNPRLAGMKTVVLINGGSASASEILAGALKDHGMAKLIGEKSFGKGSVQELTDLPGGSALKVTIAKWLTPSGASINKNGLMPEIELKLTEENTKDGQDPQMEKALEEITK